MFSQKKKKKERKNEHKYIFLCLHHLYTEGRNSRVVAGKWSYFPNTQDDKCHLQSPRARVGHLTSDKGTSPVFPEIKLCVSVGSSEQSGPAPAREECAMFGFILRTACEAPTARGKERSSTFWFFPIDRNGTFLPTPTSDVVGSASPITGRQQ